MGDFQTIEQTPMGNELYLITDCVCVFISLSSIIGNAWIIYLFSTKRLDSRRNLRIILYMAGTDIAFSIMILPQVFFMIANWQPIFVNYDPYIIAATGWPLPFFFKVSAGLNFGAALERILALYFPMLYRKIDHVKCTNILMAISIFLGIGDTILELLSFRFVPRINCSSIGCFVNSTFRTFWGASNMTCGIVIIVMSIFVFFKVQKLGRQTGWLGNTPAERKKNMATTQKFRQANRTTCGVLFSCLFCLTIPSLLVSLVETVFGFSVFEKVGPFYACTLLASGLMNCIIFLMLNSNITKSKPTRVLSEAGITTVASSKPLSSR